MTEPREIEKCTTCGTPLPHGYTACDETMGQYCDGCWPAVKCEELHGEGCATSAFVGEDEAIACAICGCTEICACETEDGPCAWSMLSRATVPICTNCEGDPVAVVLAGNAFLSVLAERMKQVQKHGRTIERDQVTNGPATLPLAAVSYVNNAIEQIKGSDSGTRWLLTFPWDPEHWRPGDARADLVKAAALIWAAIDRLDHAARDAGDVA